MIRPGNAIAIGILAVSSGGLIARAAVALAQDRPAVPASSADERESSIVAITGFAFPESITVAIGGVVTWINNDGAPHTVTFDAAVPSPSSVDLPPNGKGTVGFPEAGTFAYICEIHPTMTGRVDVSTPSPSAPTDEPDQDGY